MALELFNSLSRQKEIFTPINPPHVGLYTCGPTVYNYPHIGNYRAYMFGDILKRYLQHSGYEVKHIMNITDIDDKTIRDSQSAGKTLAEFTEFYTEEFYKDRDALNIIPADAYTKATDYVHEMVAMIESLLAKGFAYKTEDGSVYFDIAKDPTYGELSHLDLSKLKDNAQGRLKSDEYEKENAQDFALWKAYDVADGDVFWETSLGKGRPGWHIECSAMSIRNLGETFDVHTGGVDNIFPHHENEIAQSECSTGKHFVNYWMHNEHLMVDGKKMSKSLGNFYTLRDIMDKGISPLAYRYWLYTGHYRTQVNFTLETVMGAQTALGRLYEAYKGLGGALGTVNQGYKNRLMESMNDDLNTPQAVATLWDLVKDSSLSNEDKKATLLDFDRVFGFGLNAIREEIIPEEIMKLVQERENTRAEKNWAQSDELRDKIAELGYEVKDTDAETKVSKIN